MEEIDINVRASGLAGGANTAARYFTLSFVLFYYLRINARLLTTKIFTSMGMVVTFLGVFYTVSRSGMLLLAAAILMLFYFFSKFKYRIQFTLITAAAVLLLVIFSSSIFSFIGGISSSISEGTDTVGLRYALWEAGFQMWQDHPITGVGIGMFKYELKNYPPPETRYLHFFYSGLVAHNMYVSMLAETGLVGFALFMLLLIKSVKDLFMAGRNRDPAVKSLASTWLIVLLVIMLGGITKTDHVDKMLWLTMGIPVFFNNMTRKAVTRALPVSQAPVDHPLKSSRKAI